MSSIEATGNPAAGIAHALAAIAARQHIVMVNVEADALAGPLLATGARGGRRLFHGLWRSAGADRRNGRLGALPRFRVVAAGKGTKYLPAYHGVTRNGVWEHYGLTAARGEAGGMNSRCSTRSSTAPNRRSKWPRSPMPANSTSARTALVSRRAAPTNCQRAAAAQAGRRDRTSGMVEVVSSLKRDGRRWRATCAGASMSCSRRRTEYAAEMFQPIRIADRCDGPLCGDVQALPSDRP